MRRNTLAMLGALAMLLSVMAPAAPAAAAPSEHGRLPGKVQLIQGYTSDPQYVGKPGAVVNALARGVSPEKLRTHPTRTSKAPKTQREARRIAENSGRSYTANADDYTPGRNVNVDPFDFEVCKKNRDKAGDKGGWVRDRFSFCGAGVAWAEVKYGDNKVSRVEAEVWLVGYGKAGSIAANNSDRYIEFQHRVEKFTFQGSDMPPHLWERDPTASLSMKVVCIPTDDSGFDSCQDGAVNGRTATINEWLESGWAETQLVSPAKTASKANGEQIQRATIFPQYSFSIDGYTPTPGSSDGEQTGVRFDSAWYMYKVPTKGSIFDRVDPFLAYSDSPDSGYKIAADHMAKALNRPGETKPPFSDKQIPGNPSDPLHRLYKGINETNRLRYNRNYQEAVKACNQWFNTPTSNWKDEIDTDGNKKQCDEFPFRSTYEGVARSMPDYATDLGGPKYQNMFSVLPLSGPQNLAAGKILCSFYSADRILNMDKFHVTVRPPSASDGQERAPRPRIEQEPALQEPDDPDETTCGNDPATGDA